ncbi:MAG: bifunctional alpha,alpha-trehalose-phosphate synthase (UDP-forming)/trehalose-phosphatase [Tannerellaceae bacterium]|nr:bifunctional alpha,alpha-trehalose-phosphate synthase (UDP-forming)/trehalose-phosphatase [Tannerellaceae bacterium]
MKLVIISNRLPLKIVEDQGTYKIVHSDGGLATGLNSLETTHAKHWIGWPGMYVEDGQEKEKINRELAAQNFHPVYLKPEQIENYYEGYSNSVLWPLCHYFSTYMNYENEYWEAYQEVNKLFSDEACRIIEPGDIVWVQDYQLMLLPALIRECVSDVSIGYFHHIPFPSYELFRALPERADLLNGLLGADLVAFHTHGYMRHFISAVYRVLNLDCNLDEIQLDSRVVDVDAFPMGINYKKYYDAILDKQISKQAKELKRNLGDAKLIVSVDRLDYSKGILIRLTSFENFLQDHPEYEGKVSLVMIVSPSRDTVDIYAELKDQIDKMVGGINGKYSTSNWTPIHYFYRAFDFEEVTALYHIADIALVTPLRDGMNLVAKEYLAAKRDQPGVLILSEMAGAAIELSDALIVNPTDTKEIEDAILAALEIPEEEQLRALQSMQEIISTQTVEQWAKDFIDELKEVKKKNHILQEKIIKKENLKRISKQYNKAKRRLILLDYDGTLVPFYKRPDQAVPSKDLLKLLATLAEDPKNRVVISSGRDRRKLDEWLGDLPIDLAAEHGAFYKEKGKWHEKIHEIAWDEEILRIMKHIVKRTPKSWLEIKKTALVWHYRSVDVWLAELRVNQLVNALMAPCARANLQIMRGNKIVEVKSSDFSKGAEAMRLISEENFDFIMAVGDDTTDEEMFQALPEEALTIKVGKCSSAAKFNIPTQPETIRFLKELAGIGLKK